MKTNGYARGQALADLGALNKGETRPQRRKTRSALQFFRFHLQEQVLESVQPHLLLLRAESAEKLAGNLDEITLLGELRFHECQLRLLPLLFAGSSSGAFIHSRRSRQMLKFFLIH